MLSIAYRLSLCSLEEPGIRAVLDQPASLPLNRRATDPTIRTMPRKSKQVPEGSFYRDLGRNLGAARIAAGKSQMEIAEHLDVTYQQVQKYERGTDRITIHRLISLAAFLEVPLLQFIARRHENRTYDRHDC
jgi:ribosome-binding protein aMBF1 (putative translation factor)